MVPNTCFSVISIPKNIAVIPKQTKINLFDPKFDRVANLNTEHEGMWKKVILDFQNVKGWPGDKNSVNIELNVFLFNYGNKDYNLIKEGDEKDKESIFKRLDGFLGISPCQNP